MKKIRKSRYEYVQLAVGERQYDDIDLSEELIVEARYIKFAVSSDAGNKYIEALPRPRNEMEILRSYEKTLNYNMDQLIGLYMYMYMNIDYLSVKKRPTVDSQFVMSTPVLF